MISVEVRIIYVNPVLTLTPVRALDACVVTALCLWWQFTWPDYSVSDEVHMDDFWLTMETEAIELAIFPTDIPITRVDASIIAPFFPPLMRGPTVINTEKDKVQSPTPRPSGTEVLFNWKPLVTFNPIPLILALKTRTTVI